MLHYDFHRQWLEENPHGKDIDLSKNGFKYVINDFRLFTESWCRWWSDWHDIHPSNIQFNSDMTLNNDFNRSSLEPWLRRNYIDRSKTEFKYIIMRFSYINIIRLYKQSRYSGIHSSKDKYKYEMNKILSIFNVVHSDVHIENECKQVWLISNILNLSFPMFMGGSWTTNYEVKESVELKCNSII
jgi:hypothetical protein